MGGGGKEGGQGVEGLEETEKANGSYKDNRYDQDKARTDESVEKSTDNVMYILKTAILPFPKSLRQREHAFKQAEFAPVADYRVAVRPLVYTPQSSTDSSQFSGSDGATKDLVIVFAVTACFERQRMSALVERCWGT